MKPLAPIFGVALLLGACAGSGRPPAGRLVEVARSTQQWTGVGVSSSGRVFVCSPRWHEPHDWSVGEVVEGSVRPFPDDAWQRWDPRSRDLPMNRFVCVQSVVVDQRDRLWVLDSGSPSLSGVIPGGAKLVGFDPHDGHPLLNVVFDADAAPPDSYLNDVRVDASRDVAYITDSGRGGIVVVDIRASTARRVLDHAPCVRAEEITPIVGGRELRFASGANKDKVARINSDGVALSPDGEFLYWQSLTGRTLRRIRTSWLRDPAMSDHDLSARVEDLGITVVADGLEMDSASRLFLTSLERNAVMLRNRDGDLFTLVEDGRLAWPDSLAIGPGPSLYVTTSQIHRTPWFDPAGRMPETPYMLFMVPLKPAPGSAR